MVKRRVSSDSESDDDVMEVTPPPGKRVRRSSNEGMNGRASGQPKDDNIEVDGDDDDALPFSVAMDDEAEREYEAKNEAAIRAAISRKAVRAGIAECGIIKSITLKDFMCHSHVTLDFGPQVNFITGRNGSGKSALLSALQIGLGARTYLTGRGSGLKNFIREGRTQAEVFIKMKNQGPEAFKHDLYGDVITIHRIFKIDGSSTWAVKNAEGKNVARNKRELSEMVENFNIQIDSPLNVLTQDAARQFLATSTPTDKYTFFLKGTQLSQLTEEYAFVRENIKRTGNFLKQKGEAIPELKQAHEDALRLRKEAHKAAEQGDRLKILKREQAWLLVAQKNNELIKEQTKHQALKDMLTRVQEQLNIAIGKAANAKAKVTEFQSQQTNAEELKQFKEDHQQLKGQIKKLKDQIMEINQTQKDMDTQIKSLRANIEDTERRIEEEHRRLQDDQKQQREALQVQIAGLQTEIAQADSQLSSMQEERTVKQAQLQEIRQSGTAAEADVRKYENEAASYEQRIQELQGSRSSKFSAFGPRTENIMQEITQRPWRGPPPIGPLGVYVTLTDDRYREVMQNQLGNLMFSFVVANVQDRNELRKILARYGHNADVIISEPDLFDYSRGVPNDPSVVTPLHILQITDEWAKRVLINQARIEKTGLALTRKAAADVSRAHTGMMVWSADCYRVISYPEGGGQSTPMARFNDRRAGTFIGRDPAAAINDATNKLQQARHQIDVAKREVQRLQAQYREQNQALETFKNTGRVIWEQQSKLKGQLQELKDSVKEDEPANIGALEKHKEDNETDMKSIMDQFAQAHERKQALGSEAHELAQRSLPLGKKIKDIEAAEKDNRAELQKLVEATLASEKEEKHWNNKLAAQQNELEGHQKVLDVFQIEYLNWHEGATKIGAEIKSDRTISKVEGEIKAVEKALRDREKRHGKTVEEMDAEVERTKKVYEEAERSLVELKAFNRLMFQALQKRMIKWHAFRRAIALRAKIQFQYHLSKRDYTGNVIFDHPNGTLHLRVQTEEAAGSQLRDKDPKSLSGGEKSYAQICLLLAMWESIASPMRCLDEFDVFMDNVNRRISMKLMIEAAKSTEQKQYLFISPLEIGNFVDVTDEVKIVRMPDPERGQQTLSFAS